MKVFTDYKATVRAAALSWGVSVAIVTSRAFDWIPQQLGTTALLTVGFGIATTVSLSRFRLTDAITQVFRVGLDARVAPSDHKYADELIHHLSTCNICKSGTSVARRCPRGRDLVRLTIEERHGKIEDK